MPTGIYLRTEYHKKRISEGGKGKKDALEVREKKRLSKLGKNNPNWKGGVKTKEYESWYKNRCNRFKSIRKFNKEFKWNGENTHTFAEWELLKKQYNFTCPCCHKSVPEIKITVDHIVPLSKGGSDRIENIQPLCSSCNKKKYTQIIKY